MLNSGIRLSFSQIDTMLYQFVNQSERINSWIAALQTLIMPQSLEYALTADKFSEQLEECAEFKIRFSRVPKISQIRILSIIQWYFPDEARFVIWESIYNIVKRVNLNEHIDISVYCTSKLNTLLYLTYASDMTTRSLFGQLHSIEKEFCSKKELDLKQFYHKLVPHQFWYKTFTTIKRYNGWTRHVKDHGSLRPGNNASDEFRNDILSFQIEEKIDLYKTQTQDLIDLTLGFIQ